MRTCVAYHSRGQINKSDRAIMWLHCLCKPQKNKTINIFIWFGNRSTHRAGLKKEYGEVNQIKLDNRRHRKNEYVRYAKMLIMRRRRKRKVFGTNVLNDLQKINSEVFQN